MKKTLLLLCITFKIMSAQDNKLDINNVSANVWPSAAFLNYESTSPYYSYTVPKSESITTIGTSGIWIGGMVGANLRVAAMTYAQTGTDFWPGPLDTSSVSISQTESDNWNRTWKISKTEIDSFIVCYNAGGIANGTYIIPNSIASWPGNGNTSMNQSKKMAPFVDVNNNGIYDPTQGDYPKIKGDQAVWFVINDAKMHTETGSLSQLGIELHCMAYSYYCSTLTDADTALNYTTFYDFEIYNRSSNTIDSTYISLWVDADMGYYNDDYVGCNVRENYAYMYNGDNFDESNNGVYGFGSDLPYLSFLLLKGPEADLQDGIDNDRDGCIDCTWNNGVPVPDNVMPESVSMSSFLTYANDFSSVNGNPNSSGGGIQYYNYMKGKFKDGSDIHYDNLYGLTNAGPPCRYMFPDTTDPIGYGLGGGPANPIYETPWNEHNAGNTPGDRRMLISYGPLTMTPQSKKELEFAIVFSRLNNNSGSFMDFNNMIRDNRNIKQWYDDHSLYGCVPSYQGLVVITDTNDQPVSFPNPATDNVRVSGYEGNSVLLEISNAFGGVVFRNYAYTSSMNIPVSGLDNGVYFIKITVGADVKILKLIKQ